MNKRATIWFIAALMALCAAQTVPAVRIERTGASCAIVCMARACYEQRVKVPKPARCSRVPLVIALPEDPRPSGSPFSRSLDQRPPPSFLS